MKRGLITWDKARLPPSAFVTRLDGLNQLMERYEIAALVVYTDVWRANDVRFVSNYMPYWNRAFAVIPRGEKPVLLCSLSPRVYPWIKTLTIHESVIPSPSLPAQLVKLATDRHWSRLGLMDLEGLPNDLFMQLRAEQLEIVDIPRHQVRAAPDAAEIAMHRRAAAIARETLADYLVESATGLTEFSLIGRIERAVRRAGAEDLVALVSDGCRGLRPATGGPVTRTTSVMAAVEYSGHWAKVARNIAGLASPPPSMARSDHLETLSAGYPWQPLQAQDLPDSAIVAWQAELREETGMRVFHGDTGLRSAAGTELL